MRTIKATIVLFAVILFYSCGARKDFDPEYVKVTNERAQKIVDEMDLKSSEKEDKVANIIAEQYRNLSWIQDTRDEEIETIKQNNLEDPKTKEQIEKLQSKADKKIADLHDSFIKDLNNNLTKEQVTAVKDGMTYGVVPKTYAAFQDMLPELTSEQKEFIYQNLVEAREHAMDAGSSDQKHWWFGKYKGKINNYLSDQGYNLKQAGEDWQERLKRNQ